MERTEHEVDRAVLRSDSELQRVLRRQRERGGRHRVAAGLDLAVVLRLGIRLLVLILVAIIVVFRLALGSFCARAAGLVDAEQHTPFPCPSR